jgi:hypothetical protein
MFGLVATYLVFTLLEGAITEIAWMPDTWLIVGVLGAGLLGVVASAVAVRRYLRDI